MIPFYWEKQPWESIILPFDGSDTIASDDSISSVGAKVFDDGGTNVSSAMIEGAPSFTTNTVQVQIKGGVAGRDYSLELKVYTTNGEQIEDDLEIKVRTKGYTDETTTTTTTTSTTSSTSTTVTI